MAAKEEDVWVLRWFVTTTRRREKYDSEREHYQLTTKDVRVSGDLHLMSQ